MVVDQWLDFEGPQKFGGVEAGKLKLKLSCATSVGSASDEI
jgi:hypothetical protein